MITRRGWRTGESYDHNSHQGGNEQPVDAWPGLESFANRGRRELPGRQWRLTESALINGLEEARFSLFNSLGSGAASILLTTRPRRPDVPLSGCS